MVLTEGLWVSCNSSCFQIKMPWNTEQCIYILICLGIVIHFLLSQVTVIEMGKFLKRQATICLSSLLRGILGTVRVERCYFSMAFLA